LSEIKRGLLEILLPEFSAPLFEIQLLFPSRRGVLPAVRSFIDFLALRCVGEVADLQIKSILPLTNVTGAVVGRVDCPLMDKHRAEC